METLTDDAVTFSWEINLGQVVSAAVFALGFYSSAIRLYYMIDKRMDRFETNLSRHSDTLIDHAKWQQRQEEHVLSIVQNLQRVIGRLEILSPRWNGEDRRTQ